ncbi:MAG: class I SAM-dependent methyltransferase [Pseudomonadota bacterium]
MKIELDGVPETMLWPLWNRAFEAQRADRLIDDPWAIDLVSRIDYDFKRSFGRPNRGHGVRSRVCDDLITRFLEREGNQGCVISLGEGLESQYWRLGEPDVTWLSIDVKEAHAVRSRLMPEAPRVSRLSFSALDFEWLDQIPKGRPCFVSALGLLMYLTEQQVVSLLTQIASRLPESEVFFDAIPEIMSKKTLNGFRVTEHYKAPRMPWGISTDALPGFLASIPNLEPILVQTYAEPFPHAMRPYNWLSKIGPIRRKLAPSLAHAATASVD